MSTRHDTRRRFEQWAKNPDCEANTISAVAGVSMADVAKAEGLEPTMGQSPFALARGTTFERGLFANDAGRLLHALINAEVLPAGAGGFLDLRLRMNGGPLTDQQKALAKSHELLKAAAAAGAKGLSKLPAIVASATLRVPGQPVMLPEGVVAIDALVLRAADDDARIEAVIGEIKTYPDRAGYTEAADLGTSRAQAGVYLHALRLVLEELALSDRVVAPSDGFLVLTRTGRNDPSIRAGEDLEFQARRAERGFVRLRAAAEHLTPFDSDDEQKGITTVLEGETTYRPSCLNFCDRAAGCRKKAESDGDSALLGDDVKRFLGVTKLPRAVALLRGAEPANDTERDLAERLRGALGRL
jgi:hypothetical protein